MRSQYAKLASLARDLKFVKASKYDLALTLSESFEPQLARRLARMCASSSAPTHDEAKVTMIKIMVAVNLAFC